MTFTVRHGRRYRATIHLGFWEQVASNVQVAEKLQAAGFVDVDVRGSGHDRLAEGTWPGADTTAEVPDEVTGVTEIT